MGKLFPIIVGLLTAFYVKDSLAGLLPDTKHCGQSLENRIVGGSETNIDEYPWVALIVYKFLNETRLNCGGSLINNRYVLTAAHCIPGKHEIPYMIFGVRLGEWNVTTDPDCQVLKNGVKACADPHLFVGIEQIHIHPDYRPNTKNQGPFHYNDIALLRLDRDVHFTKFIQPICLPVRPYQRKENFDGVAMQVSGWGFTETGRKSTVKKKVTVKGFEFERCRKIYLTRQKELKPPQMCAGGEPNKNSCDADSGGPLMVKQNIDSRDVYVLVGLVSLGYTRCASAEFPGVYTTVGPYMEWIESLLQP